MFVDGDVTILHADLDAFYASVEQRDNPRLRGRPIIVGAGVVLAASYEAKARGVRTAMGGARAGRLCPDAVVVPPRFSAYLEASKSVFEVFEQTTPLVEGLSIDEAFLDVRGMRRLSGTPVEIAARLRRGGPRRRAPRVFGTRRGRTVFAGRPTGPALGQRPCVCRPGDVLATLGVRTAAGRAGARPRPAGAAAAPHLVRRAQHVPDRARRLCGSRLGRRLDEPERPVGRGQARPHHQGRQSPQRASPSRQSRPCHAR